MADASAVQAAQDAAQKAAAAVQAAHTPSRFHEIVQGAEARLLEFFGDLGGSPEVQRVIADLMLVAGNTALGMIEEALPPVKLFDSILQRVEQSALTKVEAEFVNLSNEAKAKAADLEKAKGAAPSATVQAAADTAAQLVAKLDDPNVAAALKAKLESMGAKFA